MKVKPWQVGLLVGLLVLFVVLLGFHSLAPARPDLPATPAGPTPVEDKP